MAKRKRRAAPTKRRGSALKRRRTTSRKRKPSRIRRKTRRPRLLRARTDDWKAGLSKSEIAVAEKAAYDREHHIGFFAPERVKRVVRAMFDRGDLYSTDDSFREYVGLPPWALNK